MGLTLTRTLTRGPKTSPPTPFLFSGPIYTRGPVLPAARILPNPNPSLILFQANSRPKLPEVAADLNRPRK